jgi:pyruvate ferredoxin oxidoreductase gamma subunit
VIEVRWHGRGGQGAFTAARLLGAAALCDGRFALAFPSFGPERRGAPILAFTRIDDRRIVDRSALRACDFAVVLDETLMGPHAADGIRQGGALLVNSARPPVEWASLGVRVLTVDAGAVARSILGRAIVNTGMIGALLAASGIVSLEAGLRAVQSEMRPALAEKNGEVLRRCHDLMKEQLGG